MASDGLPAFRVPEAEADELAGFLRLGTLLERRDTETVAVPEAKAPHAPSSLPQAPSRDVPGKGPLVRVYRSGRPEWTFLGGLDPVAFALPTRRELCRALADQAAAAACAETGEFLLVDGEGGPRRIVATLALTAEKGRLVALDPGPPVAARGGVDIGILRSLRSAPLPDGLTLLVAEEQVRKGSLTGTQHGLFLVDGAGALSRLLEEPAESSEPRPDGIAVQRRFGLEISPSPEGPRINVHGTETAQVIATGAVRSRRDSNRTYRWDRTQRLFTIERRTK